MARSSDKEVTSYIPGTLRKKPIEVDPMDLNREASSVRKSNRSSYENYESYYEEREKLKRIGIRTDDDYLRYKSGKAYDNYMEKRGVTPEDILYPYGRPSEEKIAFDQQVKTLMDQEYRRMYGRFKHGKATEAEHRALFNRSALKGYVFKKYNLKSPK